MLDSDGMFSSGERPLKSIISFIVCCAAFTLSAVAADKGGVPATTPRHAGSEAAQVALILPFTSPGDALPALLSSAVASAPVAVPAPAVVPVTPARAEMQHKFFDLKNSIGLAALASGLSADAISTQKGLGLPGFHEMNPIARPFVQSRAGAAMYNAASFAFMSGSMYLAHKTNHHKLERVLPFAMAGWEGFLAVRNYHMTSSSTTH